MRVLILAPDLPYPLNNGGKIRNHNIVRRIADDHSVTLVTFDRTPEHLGRLAAVEKLCDRVVAVPLGPGQTRKRKRAVQFRTLFSRRPYHYYWAYSPEMQAAIDDVVSSEDFDVIQVESAQMAYYRLPAGVPVVLDAHNVEFDLLRRVYESEPASMRKLFAYLEWRKFRRDELAAVRAATVCTVPSARDREVFIDHVPDARIEVVPNGVDTEFFRADPSVPAEPNTILFTGTIDYYPNTDGLTYFFDRVLPLIRDAVPDVRVTVAGRNPPPSVQKWDADPAVTITGAVDDIRPYYDRSALFVVPLRIGGGTRLKILEAMAMSKAIVSTTIGAEGIDAEDGRHLVLADEPSAFAAEVARLLGDEGRREELATHGSMLVAERYDWRAITEQLKLIHKDLVTT